MKAPRRNIFRSRVNGYWHVEVRSGDRYYTRYYRTRATARNASYYDRPSENGRVATDEDELA